MTIEQIKHLDQLHRAIGDPGSMSSNVFRRAIVNAYPEIRDLAMIGLAVQEIRRDEWEYILKTFEAGNDRQWAIATAIRKALNLEIK